MKKPIKKPKMAARQASTPPSDPLEQIRQRAYELWEQSGREHGREIEHWLEAEREVLRLTTTTNR